MEIVDKDGKREEKIVVSIAVELLSFESRRKGMELSKELKEKVENATSAEEAKKILEEAGITLTDAELD